MARSTTAELRRGSLFSGRLIRQKIGVENLACNRRRRRGAESAVLHQNRDGYLGVINGRKRDEPGVITIAFSDILGVILLILLDGDHLRGSGLAGDFVLRADSHR